MSAPFYVSPEQQTQDKAEFARKGISRGKPIVALDYDQGILMIAENRSNNLRKFGEIYDQIAFGAVGKLDEYENLRKQGVRYADMRGYSFSRDDVCAANLATEYSAVLGHQFSQPYAKPLEVELLICEVGEEKNSYFQVMFDGFVRDCQEFVTIGGEPEKIDGALREGFAQNMSLPDAFQLGVRALAQASNGSGTLDHKSLEVVLLDRGRIGRKFRRLSADEIRGLEGS